MDAPFYYPVLRAKAGEVNALSSLAAGIKKFIRPCLVVPPVKDSGKLPLFPDEDRDGIPNTSTCLLRVWPRELPIAIDPYHLRIDLKEIGISSWLPEFFRRAVSLGSRVVPVADVRLLSEEGVDAFAKVVGISGALSFRISYEDLTDDRKVERINYAVSEIPLNPEKCELLIDFGDNFALGADVVAGVIDDVYDAAYDLTNWGQVVFQGSSYPFKNNAPKGGSIKHPRVEYDAWSRSIARNGVLGRKIAYGDYGPDTAIISFSPSKAKAIPHFRYSTESSFVISRGIDGKMGPSIKDAAKRIVSNPDFSGEAFSNGDAFIRNCASGYGPGSPTMWRSANMNHHFTLVVAEIAKVEGVRVPELQLSASNSIQGSLFSTL